MSENLDLSPQRNSNREEIEKLEAEIARLRLLNATRALALDLRLDLAMDILGRRNAENSSTERLQIQNDLANCKVRFRITRESSAREILFNWSDTGDIGIWSETSLIDSFPIVLHNGIACFANGRGTSEFISECARALGYSETESET